MARFWLATFALKQQAASAASAAEPLAAADALAWAVEVIHDDVLDENGERRDEYAVLFSTVDSADDPKKLVCRIGFANGSKSCGVWHDRGFPLVDAIIERRDSDLSVRSPCFLDPPEMNYTANVVSIANIMPAASSGISASREFTAAYEQKLQVPDVAYPATRIEAKAVRWSPTRSSVKELKDIELKLKMARSRYPSLAPFKVGAVKPVKFWSGNVELPKWPPYVSKVAAERTSRIDTFGVAAFQFENVEMLGFRIDLTKLGRDDDDGLAALIEPLNFHIDQPPERISSSTRTAVSDFRYRPASRTLMLELLRYDKR